MEWLTANWYWLLFAVVMGLCLFGHGGHGGHGNRDKRDRTEKPAPQQGHQH